MRRNLPICTFLYKSLYYFLLFGKKYLSELKESLQNGQLSDRKQPNMGFDFRNTFDYNTLTVFQTQCQEQYNPIKT